MRLIDADLLRVKVERAALQNNGEIYFYALLDSMPTIPDAVTSIEALKRYKPIKKGKWIDGGKERMIRWQCSVCGRKDRYIYNFCPDCGADMREEEE